MTDKVHCNECGKSGWGVLDFITDREAQFVCDVSKHITVYSVHPSRRKQKIALRNPISMSAPIFRRTA